jgi:hypothetical protein
VESELALQLATLIASCEKREREVAARELTVTDREGAVLIRELAVKEKEELVSIESATLNHLRDVAREQRSNADNARKNLADAEVLREAREQHQNEVNVTRGKISMEQKNAESIIAAAQSSLKDIERREEELKQAQVKHHERVLKDLSEIELKKMRMS